MPAKVGTRSLKRIGDGMPLKVTSRPDEVEGHGKFTFAEREIGGKPLGLRPWEESPEIRKSWQ